jgi:hypothetical protein
MARPTALKVRFSCLRERIRVCAPVDQATRWATPQGVGIRYSDIRLCNDADGFRDATALRLVLSTLRQRHQSGIMGHGVPKIAALFGSFIARARRGIDP